MRHKWAIIVAAIAVSLGILAMQFAEFRAALTVTAVMTCATIVASIIWNWKRLVKLLRKWPANSIRTQQELVKQLEQLNLQPGDYLIHADASALVCVGRQTDTRWIIGIPQTAATYTVHVGFPLVAKEAIQLTDDDMSPYATLSEIRGLTQIVEAVHLNW